MSNLPPLASIPLPAPPAPNDRLKANTKRLFDLLLPFLAYMVPWEYLVVAVTPGPPVLIDAVPVDPIRCPHGPHNSIVMWRGPAGSPCMPAPGSRVLLRFNDGSPAKPAICGVDPLVPFPVPATGVAPESMASILSTFASSCIASSDGTLSSAATAMVTRLGGLL